MYAYMLNKGADSIAVQSVGTAVYQGVMARCCISEHLKTAACHSPLRKCFDQCSSCCCCGCCAWWQTCRPTLVKNLRVWVEACPANADAKPTPSRPTKGPSRGVRQEMRRQKPSICHHTACLSGGHGA